MEEDRGADKSMASSVTRVVIVSNGVVLGTIKHTPSTVISEYFPSYPCQDSKMIRGQYGVYDPE